MVRRSGGTRRLAPHESLVGWIPFPIQTDEEKPRQRRLNARLFPDAEDCVTSHYRSCSRLGLRQLPGVKARSGLPVARYASRSLNMPILQARQIGRGPVLWFRVTWGRSTGTPRIFATA